MADWLIPTAIHSKCGEHPSYPATYAIDEDTESFWVHLATCFHWIVFDLGATKALTKVRVWGELQGWGYGGDSEVYVSDDPGNWGAAVWVGTFTLWGQWYESGEFSKSGRYVKLVSQSDESQQAIAEFQPYGSVPLVEHETTLQISESADDGEIWDPIVWPEMDPWWTPQSSYADLCDSIYGVYRWPGVPIPQGMEVSLAEIVFSVYAPNAEYCDLRVEAFDEDNSAQLASRADYVSRPKTATVNWNDVEEWVGAYPGNEQWYESVDIKAAIQAVVDRSGWQAENAIQVVIRGIVGYEVALRRPCFYNLGAPWAPKLHLKWWAEATPGEGQPMMRRWGGIPGMRLTGRGSW